MELDVSIYIVNAPYMHIYLLYMQVTCSGQPIRDVSVGGHGKLPYERLLVTIPIVKLGRQPTLETTPQRTARQYEDDARASSYEENAKQVPSVRTIDRKMTVNPNFLLVSTPSALHSHKPPLNG